MFVHGDFVVMGHIPSLAEHGYLLRYSHISPSECRHPSGAVLCLMSPPLFPVFTAVSDVTLNATSL